MKLHSRLTAGKASSRIYLMDLHPGDFPNIIPYLDREALQHSYTKIFAKIPARYMPAFINAGYETEAWIPGFYNNKYDVFFMVKYFSADRKLPEKAAMEAFQQLMLHTSASPQTRPPRDYILKALGEEEIDQMTNLYKKVFESYPFPIFDSEFLLKSMLEDDTRYFGAFHSGSLVALSSAEYRAEFQHAEMTDFAVNNEHRGQKLALNLLAFMEQELSKADCRTFYTIARLHSLPMNKTFMNMGYHYSGTLINNTHISGNIESMNVWYKKA